MSAPGPHAATADPVWRTDDRAFGVPGSYTVARCRVCGFLYQRPRVADDDLAACYPDHYPRHQERSPRVPLKGSSGRRLAARWALAEGLGYRGLAPPRRLSHFTPASLERAVAAAGGRIVWQRQQAKPRPYLWSVRLWLRDRRREGLARVTEWRPVYGVMKLALELALPLVAGAGRGEAIRIGVRPQ